jgi:hypothetical protein
LTYCTLTKNVKELKVIFIQSVQFILIIRTVFKKAVITDFETLLNR